MTAHAGLPSSVLLLCAAASLGAGCGHTTPAGYFLTADTIRDPQACAGCHPDHFTEWSGSMHAYAAADPVFKAMNARGQRETNGALGTFCLNCHAPMAVRTGATQNGLDGSDTSPTLSGVTCYFCHSIDAVNGTHNDPLSLAGDSILRGGIEDPVPNMAHASAYAPILDRNRPESATLCGSCHDIVSPLGAHIERTFAEWQSTVYSHGTTALTCGECHMEGRDGPAAQVQGAPVRRVHAHTFPGVDVALGTFPDVDVQQAAVQTSLDTTLQAEVCVRGQSSFGNATIQIVLDNVAAGHLWPSGATQDRRAWVEVIAYDASNNVLYQSGVVPDGTSVTAIPATVDPDLWLIRDCMFGTDDKQASMFWEAASVDSNQLPGPTTNVTSDPAYYLTHVLRSYPRSTSTPPSLATYPSRVTMRVRLVPVGLDVLDDLIQSGDLDPSVKPQMPVFTLKGTQIEWTMASSTLQYLDGGIPVACVSGGLSTGANAATPAPEHTRCQP